MCLFFKKNSLSFDILTKCVFFSLLYNNTCESFSGTNPLSLHPTHPILYIHIALENYHCNNLILRQHIQTYHTF